MVKVRERDNHSCIYCGIKAGDVNKNNKVTKCDSHHFLSRDIKNSPLKFDLRNGATLCPEHHKFSGMFSAHKSPINFYDWLRIAKPEQYEFVKANSPFRVNLSHLDVLNEIKRCLENNLPLDLNKLKEISDAASDALELKEEAGSQDENKGHEDLFEQNDGCDESDKKGDKPES